MRRGKYGTVIGRKLPIFVCAQYEFTVYGFFSANHSAVFPPSHQTTEFRQTRDNVNCSGWPLPLQPLSLSMSRSLLDTHCTVGAFLGPPFSSSGYQIPQQVVRGRHRQCGRCRGDYVSIPAREATALQYLATPISKNMCSVGILDFKQVWSFVLSHVRLALRIRRGNRNLKNP